MNQSTKFRKSISKGVIIAPGAHNPLVAKIIQFSGFEAVYMTGFGTSVSMLGLPDVGLITSEEMIRNARNIVDIVDIPVIADADTGYGNAINVRRTIKGFIRSGVAGVHIEDQEFPKRCGHVAGKRVVSIEEMVGKITAAIDVRDEEDEDFYVIARTDSKTVLGITEAIERGKEYYNGGADMIFFDGITSLQEAETIAKKVDAPLLYNVAGMAPLVPISRLDQMGYRLIIFPTSALRVSIQSVLTLMKALKRTGPQILEDMDVMKSEDLYSLVGFSEVRKLEEKYLPKEEVVKKYLTEGWEP